MAHGFILLMYCAYTFYCTLKSIPLYCCINRCNAKSTKNKEKHPNTHNIKSKCNSRSSTILEWGKCKPEILEVCMITTKIEISYITSFYKTSPYSLVHSLPSKYSCTFENDVMLIIYLYKWSFLLNGLISY